ncbi:DUF6049 family protein [Agrococcus sp. DT81.2]|uniref:DUF6049 family protein n=1 Tax=Agrococcus sp. DT81.2 TaxID=3393414 RepID=UPI003CE48D9F
MLSAGRVARRRASACAAVAVATALLAAPMLAPSTAHAAAPAIAPEEAPTLRLAPVDPLLSTGEALDVEVMLENPGRESIPATTIELLLTTAPISTRYGLSRWFDGQGILASSVVAMVDLPAVSALGRTSTTVSVAPDVLGLDDAPWGAYGLAASAPDMQGGTSVVVRDAPGEASPTRLAIAAPIEAGVEESGLLPADELESLTETGGAARDALDAALAAGATIGVDPAIGASAEALGDDAPEAADEWLELADTSDTYALQYANADPIAQVRAGAFPLRPLGIPREDDVPLPPGTGTVGASAPVIDATQAVMQQADLEGLADAGTIVLSTANLDETLEGSTPNAHVTVGGVDVLAADAEVQERVRDSAATDADVAAQARAELVALLATITRERPSDPRTLAAVLPSTTQQSPVAVLRMLDEAGFVDTVAIDDALDVPARPADLAAADDPDRDAGAGLVAAALEQEAEAARVASIVEEPASLLAGLRLALLAALPDAGRPVTDADRAAIESLGGELSQVGEAVHIIGGSDIRAVGESVGLPITIANELGVQVEVVLSVRPLNALVTVPQPRTDLTLAPTTQQRVQVPIDVVGTGTVLMVAQLHTPDGVVLGPPQTMRITAQPTIETAVAVALGIAIVLLIVFGIWRSVRKRRRGEARGDADDAGDREAVDRPVKETL